MTSLGQWCAVWTLVLFAAYSAPIIQDDQEAVDRLVRQFAPLLYLHPDERWNPDDVDTFLGNVRLQVGMDDIVPLVNGSLPVGPHTEKYHIIAQVPTGVGTPDVTHLPFLAGTAPEEAPVYVTVTRCGPVSTNRVQRGVASPSFIATYWTFHPFNEGKRAFGKMRGNHVGDWEHVSVRVKEGVLKEIFVSSHNFGAYYAYCPESDTFNFTTTKGAKFFNPKFPPHLELNGTHPVLYVALGSHGLWTTPGKHRYNRVPSLVDVTAEGGAEWPTWRRLVLTHRSPPAWLQYAGLWGNPANCGIIKTFCELTEGPPGLAGREPDFQCGVRTRRAWSWAEWINPFGRRRRRDVAVTPLFS